MRIDTVQPSGFLKLRIISECTKGKMGHHLFTMKGFRMVLLTWLIFSPSVLPSVFSNKTSSCPNECVCSDGLVVVRCIDRLFTEVPVTSLRSGTQELSLRLNILTRIPDKVFIGAPSLKYLDLSENIISVLEPLAFAGIRFLLRLLLFGNRLVGVTAVSDLHFLQQLSLNGNFLKNLFSLQITPLYNGLSLELSGNPLESLANLDTVVQRLHAESCGLWIFDVHKSTTADKILYLSLEHNRIKSIPSLDAMRSLLLLKLTGNLIAQINPSIPTSLQRIYLNDNQIREYRSVSQLSVFHLVNNQVFDVSDVVSADTDSLEELYLADNPIQTANFPRLTSLDKLDLSRCQFRGVFTLDTTKLPFLTNLLLSNNHITVFDISNHSAGDHYVSTREDFHPFGTNLEVLVLDNNDISDLSSLRHLTSLLRLSANNNELRSILWNDGDATHGKVQSISLEGNRFSILRGFRNMTELNFLNLQDNEIVTISQNALRGAKHLRVLNMAGNKLKTFPTFSGVQSIQTLKLQCNALETIESHHLDQFPELSTLNLSQNKLVNLTTARNSSLKTLLLGYNLLKLNGDFNVSGLNKLGILSLQGNQIEHVNNDFWHGTETLFYLDLSLNNLTSGSSLLLNARGLGVYGNNNNIATLPELFLREQGSVFLSRNRLLDISPRHVASVCLVSLLDLSWNRIEVVPSDTFEPCTGLRMVNLEGNPMTNIAEGTFLGIRQINFGSTLLVSIPWATLSRDHTDFSLLELNNLKLASNISDVLSTSSRTFLCLGLRNNGLAHVPKFGSALVLDLDLSHNRISMFSVETFRSLRTLRRLIINHNDLQTIPEGAFQSCHRMRLLSIEFNCLKHISPGAFDGIEHTHVRLGGNSMVSVLPSVLPIIYSYVSLGFNPWHCNCTNLALSDWLDRNGNDKQVCHTPEELLGKSILSAFAEQLNVCRFSKDSDYMGSGDFEDGFLITSLQTVEISKESEPVGSFSLSQQDCNESVLLILLLGVFILTQYCVRFWNR